MIGNTPPFVVFILGALLLPLFRGWSRPLLLCLIPVIGAFNLINMNDGLTWNVSLFSYQLTPLRVDRLSHLFGYLFHLAAFLGIVFSLHVKETSQHVVGLLYAGSAIGAVFSGDLITLFVFWELLAISSVFFVWARRTPQAIQSGFRYLIIQILSGLLLLVGILMHAQEYQSVSFGIINWNDSAAWLFFLAFGIKAAFPFLHNWLTDAYPEATPTGTVFLSAFTTKVAIYCLARAFPGTEMLIYIGTAMTCFPIFYAVIENDLRRVLAYSMINQLGFMVCGIGLGTALSINGAVSHAFNDVIFKGLLFMAMGSVLHMTGRMNGSDLGGLYKTMPWTTGFCIVGACSISAFPLFSGFVSKSMVMAAAIEQGHSWVWIGLLFASAGVFHHAGIKIPFFAFFAHDSGIRVKDPPTNMLIAMGLSAGLCVFIGSYPWLLYSLLPMPVDYVPYDLTHVFTQMQLLFFSALAFCWLKLSGLYPPELPSVNLDVEWFYRKLGPQILEKVVGGLQAIRNQIEDQFSQGRAFFLSHEEAYRALIVKWFHHPWPTGSMTLWAVGLLGIILFSYYFY